MAYTLEDWWSSLTVTEKERIGGKISQKKCIYPECTKIWETLPPTIKQQIHDHCTAKHGDEMTPWQDGIPYSY